MTNELTATSILSLFNTTKEQRQTFVSDVINRLSENNPLEIHLQVKMMEEVIKQLTSSPQYKEAILLEAEKYGTKSFGFQNAKVEIREVGVKYDYSTCGDSEYYELASQIEQLTTKLKQREMFLKSLPDNGLEAIDEATGEIKHITPPSKSSTTSVVVTLK